MIAFQCALQSANSCLILGERHGGKIALACLLAERAGARSIQLVSPFNKALTDKKLQDAESAVAHWEHFSLTPPLTATDTFTTLKAVYGFDFLLQDFIRIVEASPADVVYFHRIDEYFAIQDRRFISQFFKYLTEAAKRCEKRLYFSLLLGLPEESLFQAEVERYLDLELTLTRKNALSNDRELAIKYAAAPVDATRFHLAHGRNGLTLSGYDNEQESGPNPKHVLVISTSDETIARLSYLLSHEQLSFHVCAGEMSDVVSALLKKPDLVIYDADDEYVLNLDLYQVAKSNHIKVIELSSQTHLRKADKLAALQQGCFDVFAHHYFIEDLVIAIEQAIGLSFYTTQVKMPSTQELPGGELIEALIQRYLTLHKGFSLFEFDLATCDSTTIEVAQSYQPQRQSDACWYNPEQQKLFVFAADILSHNREVIESKVLHQLPNSQLLSVKEATDFAQWA